MKRISTSEAVKLLRDNDNFLILTHKRPDGDTLGSAAALASALRRSGKRAWLLRNGGATDKYMPFIQRFFTPRGFTYVNEYIVSVDVASLTMISDRVPQHIELAIDHHSSNTEFADNLLLDGSRSACGELILEVIEELCGSVTKEEADLLYIALSTDTGCFQYGNTNADSFAAASRLAKYGADIAGLNLLFFRTVSRSRLMLEGMIYSSLLSYKNNKINIAVVTQAMMDACGATENDMDDLASLPGKVEGTVVSALVKEKQDGTSKISLRSTGLVNVSDVCAMFGGGGHAMAAGCEMPDPPAKAAELLAGILEDKVR